MWYKIFESYVFYGLFIVFSFPAVASLIWIYHARRPYFLECYEPHAATVKSRGVHKTTDYRSMLNDVYAKSVCSGYRTSEAFTDSLF